MTLQKSTTGSLLDVAHFSSCGRYRYLLTREFAGDSTCLFVMLNPSTADASHNDPTIRRCIGFAKREGFGRLEVVNLYGYMATKPADLFACGDPVGDGNDLAIAEALGRADLVVVAWGNHGSFDVRRISALNDMISDTGMRAKCFGLTGEGQPKHPLYLRSEAELVDYSAPLS
ncbi:MAG: DUF1643 domain-containing protein [Chloroflexi bacterium]|nr:DUF1643 domain-containing protein [Chloroflexota bacterium]